MPQTKRTFLRYQIIDRELSRIAWRRVKTQKILDILLEEFDMNVSKRMLQLDIRAMVEDHELAYFAPIEYDTRAKAYYYSDPEYSIKKFRLKEEEINSLRFFLNVFKQYSGYGILQNLVSAVEKIESTIQIERKAEVSDLHVWEKVLVEPFSPLNSSVGDLISLLVQAIDRKRKVKFEYKKFTEAQSTTRVCNRAWIKEFGGFWYFIGESREGILKTFALDRMVQLEILEKYGEAPRLDFEKFYVGPY